MTTKNPKSVSFISLGCPKNLVDSEQLVSTLLSRGYRVLSDASAADLVVVNTCGFLGASRNESLGAIREAVALKRHGVKAVLVAGCMVGNYRELLDKEAPGVDRYLPFADYDQIDRVALDLVPESAPASFTVERLRIDAALTPAHFAYLKISEGCNHTCAFCVIPQIRGPMHSVGTEDLVLRARKLVERGVREIVLIAQDSTVYGTDLYGENRLVPLLDRLDRVEGLEWIRLMYAYPTEVKAPLMDRLANSSRLLPYLDVPIQHASDAVLKRMRRGYGRKDLDRMIDGLRSRNPSIALRTTVIVGFPGESDADFDSLAEFISQARFDRLGAFKFSREPGSLAHDLDGQVPEDKKEERWHRLLQIQQAIALEKNHDRIGSTERVLLEAAGRPGVPAKARSYRDAPEVDAQVLIDDAPDLQPGTFATVTITAADGYDVRARVL